MPLVGSKCALCLHRVVTFRMIKPGGIIILITALFELTDDDCCDSNREHLRQKPFKIKIDYYIFRCVLASL